jgi:hypothetical protein
MSIKTFDMEVFFDEILNLFKTEYNNCLEQINALKKAQDSSDIPAKLIPPDCFYYGGINATQLGNTPLFIAYDFANSNEISDVVSSSQAETITLNFSVNIVDNRLSDNLSPLKALLRYQRAMIVLANKNTLMFDGIGRLEATNLQPIVADIANVRLRSAGVSLTLTIGH